ncbi:MAG: dihydropteroate synthase, partial [Acidimicrobiia bacterium]
MPGLTLDRPAVMGIVNVTPDSFSDGGRYLDAGRAVAHGLDLVVAGADMLDVGGESTRPGSARVEAGEEIRRVVPVVHRLAAEGGVPVSVDTMKAEVAAAALEAGASVVTDVSAGRADDGMLGVVAGAGAGNVAMLISSVTTLKLEDIVKGGNGPKIYQLYVRGDDNWVADRVKQAMDAGYDAFCITVDTQVYSRRERDIAKRFVKSWRTAATGQDHQAAFSWDNFKKVKDKFPDVKFMLKGIGTGEDAD